MTCVYTRLCNWCLNFTHSDNYVFTLTALIVVVVGLWRRLADNCCLRQELVMVGGLGGSVSMQCFHRALKNMHFSLVAVN